VGFFDSRTLADVFSSLCKLLGEVAAKGGDNRGAMGFRCSPLAPGERTGVVFMGWLKGGAVCVATDTVKGARELDAGAPGQVT